VGGWIAVIIVGLALLAYLFEGIGWIFTHEMPFVILAAVIVVMSLVIAATGRRTTERRQISTALRKVEAMKPVGIRAEKAVAVLVEDRQLLERKSHQLEELRHTLAGDINFQVLAQQHNESRLLADSWYAHKDQAIRSQRQLSSGIGSFNSHAKKLTQASSISGDSPPRSRFARDIATAQATINHLASIVANLRGEIGRSRTALVLYNGQTGDLRDHIRDNCGPRGRRWYDELQRRKSDRNIDI
jgi:chromosome segregation ATPase